ncbi:MAG: hypothetical protein ACRD4S_09900 [Candidatus Acidiferrales bacterium]
MTYAENLRWNRLCNRQRAPSQGTNEKKNEDDKIKGPVPIESIGGNNDYCHRQDTRSKYQLPSELSKYFPRMMQQT